jgi:hypothetical protein
MEPQDYEPSRAEEYAMWLVVEGIKESAHEDLNEGGDPLSEREEPLEEGEWRQACELASAMSDVIDDNSVSFLAWVEAHHQD